MTSSPGFEEEYLRRQEHLIDCIANISFLFLDFNVQFLFRSSKYCLPDKTLVEVTRAGDANVDPLNVTLQVCPGSFYMIGVLEGSFFLAVMNVSFTIQI